MHVEGEHSKHHAGHKPRKAGGRALVDDFVNRDQKEANQERAGTKHIGGMKEGGRTHKMVGGPLMGAGGNMMGQRPGGMMMRPMRGQMMNRGGHADAKEDKDLIKSMVKHDAMKGATEKHDASCRCHKCMGGEAHGGMTEVHHASCACPKCHGGMAKCSGGSVSDGELEGTRPTGGRMARKHGGRADAHWIEHADLKKGALHRELHVPEGEKIPEKKLHGAEHSSNKLVAKRAELAATLRGLPREHHASGGKAGKGKMNVNIVIAPSGHADGMGGPSPMGAGPMPPPRPVMPPQGPMMPPNPAISAPPGMGAPPMPPGAGMPPPQMMGRKRGGRTEAGAGSGLGRLEKIRDYGHKAERDPAHY